MQETRAFHGNQSLQVSGASQTSQEHFWTDKDYRGLSTPSSARPMKRFLTDTDKHELFRINGQATGNADLAQEKNATPPERRHKRRDEIGRSNTAKRIKQRRTKEPSDAAGKESDKVERMNEPSNSKRRRRVKDSGKAAKGC